MSEGKFYTYEEALSQSVEYFKGNELSAKVFLDKYALRDHDQNLLEKTPDDMHRRIAKEFARIEKPKFEKPLSEEDIYGYLKDFAKIIPQGSPMYGIGNPYQFISLSNCYVVETPLDSYAGIHRTDEQLSQISKRRGGCGLDISHLRPAGSNTKNAARTSTGIIPFMERFSNSIREVGQSGRRGALMITISVHHPQVSDFIKIKKDLTRVTGANISVRLTDEFLEAVDKDTEYEQRWPVDAKKPKISKKIQAREVWSQIIESAHGMAEPGLLFWDKIIEESPADCYADQGFATVSTNPCSELPLSVLDSCRLMLLNILTYVKNPFTNDAVFDFEGFAKDCEIAQRLMDDMIDLESECVQRIIDKIANDPEPEDIKQTELAMWRKIKENCETGRRTGTGITALGDALAALGVKYGSDESIDLTEKIYRQLKLSCYRSSVEMAKELGAFKFYDAKAEAKNAFIQRIKEEDPKLYADMEKYGRRNIALLTTAPAGTVSIETQTTSGIEPLFMMSYKRRKKINPNDENARVDFVDPNKDSWQEFKVYHPQIENWMKVSGKTDENESPWAGCCAENLDWKQRVKLQAAAQLHVDHAISSTINLPNDVSIEKVDEIYRTAWKAGCKGITIYRDGCRTGVLVKEEKKVEKTSIAKTNAPKRPQNLPCDVHHVKVNGKDYFVMVGKLNDEEPYEVFAGVNGFIDKGIKHGTLIKRARGKYDAALDDGTEVKDIADHITDEEEAITRMTSTALRHGSDIHFIVHQLEKVKGSMTGFSKAMSRALKKYIKDGSEVKGEECSECKGKLIRSEGCSKCVSCGWSRCS